MGAGSSGSCSASWPLPSSVPARTCTSGPGLRNRPSNVSSRRSTSKDFQGAYKMWCPTENSCKYNPFEMFEKDWGPATPYSHGSAAKIDNIDYCGEAWSSTFLIPTPILWSCGWSAAPTSSASLPRIGNAARAGIGNSGDSSSRYFRADGSYAAGAVDRSRLRVRLRASCGQLDVRSRIGEGSPPPDPSGRVFFGPPRGGPGTPDPGQITWTNAA